MSMQQYPLLQTKLYIPPIRPELVSRPRLIERLNEGLTRKLTLISAPAGFGKTMLLSEWAAGVSDPTVRIAWLSLDEGDTDLARFLAYFVAALQTVEGNLGQGLSAALESPGPVNAEQVLTALINEMARRTATEVTDEHRRLFEQLREIEQSTAAEKSAGS
jgi:LuxR family maltose regulon positive regulatory protein